ncbi:MAG: acyl-CoA dehydrogenase family protein [Ardenticatenaceae bacterium]
MTEQYLPILDWLLSQEISNHSAPQPSIAAWKRLYDQHSAVWSAPVDRAIVGGFVADRVAYAFAGGYQAALRRLLPSLPLAPFVALCVTEKGGGHPRAIESHLRAIDETTDNPSWRLNGSKQFVTCANEAEILLVVASTGTDEDGRKRLRMVLLNRETPGLTIKPMTPLRFVPEISHGTLHFAEVAVEASQLLPGDGYTRYVKPFRTIEDLHIFAAILAYVYRIASQYSWPQAQKEQLLTLLVTIRTLALSDPSAPALHIALGGLQTQIESVLTGATPYWAQTHDAVRQAWQRDNALMKIAQKVRHKRLAVAWARYATQ